MARRFWARDERRPTSLDSWVLGTSGAAVESITESDLDVILILRFAGGLAGWRSVTLSAGRGLNARLLASDDLPRFPASTRGGLSIFASTCACLAGRKGWAHSSVFQAFLDYLAEAGRHLGMAGLTSRRKRGAGDLELDE